MQKSYISQANPDVWDECVQGNVYVDDLKCSYTTVRAWHRCRLPTICACPCEPSDTASDRALPSSACVRANQCLPTVARRHILDMFKNLIQAHADKR